jgi:cobaltochelatase CobS
MPVAIVNEPRTDSKPSTLPKHDAPLVTRIAARDRKACRGCAKPIPRGTTIARVPNYSGTGYTWTHPECIDKAAPPKLGAYAPPTAPRTVDKADAMQIAKLESTIITLSQRLADLESATPRRIEIKVGQLPDVQFEGAVHPKLDRVIRLLNLRKPVFIPGPAGSGKSYLAQQAAEVLQLPFYSVSCSIGMTESNLVGRQLPMGEQGQFQYVSTPFMTAYESGGLFLLDEIDAADSSVLLCINSAIANGKVQLAIRPEKPLATMHEQFRIIAAANTFGRGADRLYVGRNQLDESTMSRFRAGVTPIGYSRELETQLWTARGHKLEDLRVLWKWRDAIEANQLERILCTRFILDAADLLAGGFEWDEVTGAFFEGWREDEVRKVKGE